MIPLENKSVLEVCTYYKAAQARVAYYCSMRAPKSIDSILHFATLTQPWKYSTLGHLTAVSSIILRAAVSWADYNLELVLRQRVDLLFPGNGVATGAESRLSLSNGRLQYGFTYTTPSDRSAFNYVHASAMRILKENHL